MQPTNPADDLYTWVGPRPEGPLPLLTILDGWIEASEAAAMVGDLVRKQGNLEPIIEFNTTALLDQRAHRPVMTLVDGVTQNLEWPTLTMSVGTDADDRPFLFLNGPEPDVSWKPFAAAVATIASTIGISQMYTVNAYPVPAPHTRPIRVSWVATCAELLGTNPRTSGLLQVPVGAQMAISEELKASGIQTLGFYAQLPYYISTSPWPQASLGLLTNLADASSLRFNVHPLESQVAEANSSVDAMLSENPPLASIVGELEQRFDDLQEIEERDLPSGDELEEELQEFLRNIDGE